MVPVLLRLLIQRLCMEEIFRVDIVLKIYIYINLNLSGRW